jgi:hypothetical protein
MQGCVRVAGRRLPAVIVVLAFLSTACASRLARPDMHEDGWLLVETQHIELRTDVDRDDALSRARKLEQYWQALASMYGLVAPGSPLPRGPFHVIHFDDCGDVDRVADHRRGFVVIFRYWMDDPVAVTCEGDIETDVVLIHELAHIFNSHYFARMPPWVNEGLATYYQSLKVTDGKAVIGAIPSNLWQLWVEPGWLPNIARLRRMNYEEFYDQSREARNYFSAWKLVHLLSGTGPDRQRRFRHYLTSLRSTVNSEDAWIQAFGDLPADEIGKEYLAYQQRERVNGWATMYKWTEPPPPRVRTLRAGEIHALWLNLLVHLRGGSDVAKQLESMAAADPDWPELLYWRAVLMERPDIRLLREYLKRRPQDGRAWRALVSVELDSALPRGYFGLEGRPPPALAAMEPDVLQLIQRASDSTSLNTIGWYFAMRQNPVTGLNFALRSVRAEPGCGACWDTAGLLYFQAGKTREALDAQERAVSLFAERAPAEALARLRRYRAAVASK